MAEGPVPNPPSGPMQSQRGRGQPAQSGADVQASWESGRVALQPLRQSDYEFVYHLCELPEVVHRWRFRGVVPDPSEFAQLMKSGVLVQFLVRKRAGGVPVGYVTAYNANHREGWVYVAGLSSPEFASSGLIPEGIRMLISYLFRVWPFRKVYLESIAFNTTVWKCTRITIRRGSPTP